MRSPPSAASTAADFDFGPAARTAARRAIKAGARRFIDYPARLDAIDATLSCAHPRRALATLGALEERFWRLPRRHFGMGGEIPLINIRSAKLATRWARRFGARVELVAAE